MHKRLEPLLRPACLILAVLVLWQLVGVIRRVNPLHGVTVPALPTLAANTNNSSGAPDNAHMVPPPPTNLIKPTNGALVSAQTNSISTNLVLSVPATNYISTNHLANTNSIAVEKSTVMETNAVVPLAAKPNTTNVDISKMMASGATNLSAATGTNGASTSNATAKVVTPMPASSRRTGMGHGGSGGKPSNLPPAIQAQITKIIDSEMLGPVPHPLPMALMGIAGDVAFLRSPSGQTGMVKIGDSLGEIKLVRIGINRVLVEQDGEQKELTIFDGYGGTSLLEKQGGTNNETHN